MAECNRTPHPLLSQWVESEGTGAMKRLVEASGRTWAAVGRIVWHGTVPKSETALRLAEATGYPVDAIIRGAIAARAARKARDAEDEAA